MPKYYRYADPNYSIFDMPLSENDYEIMNEAIVEDTDMKAKIAHLLELKKRSNEHNLEPVDEQLFAWAQEWAEFYDQKVEQLHPEKKTSLDDKLNKLMYDTVTLLT